MMSSAFNRWHTAEKAINKSIDSFALSKSALDVNQWLSVHLPAKTAVGRVEIYNHRDPRQRSHCDLFPFEVFLGTRQGDLLHDCGGGPQYATSCPASIGPYAVECGGRSDLPFVTVVIRAGRQRLLMLSEVKVFTVV